MWRQASSTTSSITTRPRYAAPTKRKTTAEVPEDSYDMCAHLSPAGISASVNDAFSRPTPREDGASPRGADSSSPDGQPGADGRASNSSSSSFPK
eukprot:5394715-Pyramimonas_sp.AAC.1